MSIRCIRPVAVSDSWLATQSNADPAAGEASKERMRYAQYASPPRHSHGNSSSHDAPWYLVPVTAGNSTSPHPALCQQWWGGWVEQGTWGGLVRWVGGWDGVRWLGLGGRWRKVEVIAVVLLREILLLQTRRPRLFKSSFLSPRKDVSAAGAVDAADTKANAIGASASQVSCMACTHTTRLLCGNGRLLHSSILLPRKHITPSLMPRNI